MADARTNFNNFYEVAQFLPSSSTDLVTEDVWIEELHLVNNTSTSRTVTVTDRQGTALPLLKDVTIDPGVEFYRKYGDERGGLKMTSGIAWSASAADAIAARIRYKT